MAKQLKITLVRSVIGYNKNQQANVRALGLGKVNSSVVHNDTPDIRGKVNKIPHLLKVEEIDE
ncbi:MAG: 50S ribosomal protein L30 [Desulfitobacteriaceae bacterium]|nr:50S ribosomal protein L30 [Desulfitobacteriaceae bacterium]MDD4751981.1 50S ribosomal protein L30 [Desulfitobacteriaceae bacterium]